MAEIFDVAWKAAAVSVPLFMLVLALSARRKEIVGSDPLWNYFWTLQLAVMLTNFVREWIDNVNLLGFCLGCGISAFIILAFIKDDSNEGGGRRRKFKEIVQ